jgi:hypothetical protein
MNQLVYTTSAAPFYMQPDYFLGKLLCSFRIRREVRQLTSEINPVEIYCDVTENAAESYIFSSSGIFKHSMGAWNRVRIGLLYRTARVQRLAELLPWNRFVGSLKV